MKYLFLGLTLSLAGLTMFKSGPVTLQSQRWDSAEIRVEKQSEVRWTVKKIERNKDRYETISKSSGVPWQFVACLHNMECGLRFDQHLHNGDPLTKRTWQVPAGRPKIGKPPFTFEESALDALQYDKMDKVQWKDLTKSLDAIEGYNGTGYRKRGLPSPYLYAGTSVERPGRYVRDGVWDSKAWSNQLGIVPILKELHFNW